MDEQYAALLAPLRNDTLRKIVQCKIKAAYAQPHRGVARASRSVPWTETLHGQAEVVTGTEGMGNRLREEDTRNVDTPTEDAQSSLRWCRARPGSVHVAESVEGSRQIREKSLEWCQNVTQDGSDLLGRLGRPRPIMVQIRSNRKPSVLSFKRASPTVTERR